MKLTKKCPQCQKMFTKPVNESVRCWNNRRKFCSRVCTNDSMKGKPAWNKGKKRWWAAPKAFKKGMIPVNWKGDDAGYFAKHRWMSRHFGKPSCCERCKTTQAKRFEWANISGKYKRVREDWARLCSSCHKLYDLKKVSLTIDPT